MNETTTSVERVRTVLSGGLPDRVPVDLHNFMMTAQASGMPFPEYFQNGEAMAEGQIKAWREFGHDVLLLENGTAALAQACGVGVEFLTESAPVSFVPVINSLEDIDKLRMPDPYKDHPLPELLKTTRIVVQEIGDKAFIIGRADQGPFSLASMILGMVEFLAEIGEAEKQALLHRLLEFSLEACYRYAVAQMEQGAHMTSIGESLAGPDVCSPKVYREYEWPYAKRLVDRLREKNIPLAYHICGNATPIVKEMAETGAAVLELDYKVDLHQVKEATRGKTTVLGPIDPSGVMALGTPELVTEKCREAIEVLGPGGGLILGPGCALPPLTPPENVHAMIETARHYGRYI
ncbi:MAG: uroporphyrinogen decarboxylase family protein [Chloroflexi bacterium]|nr:uroporphyrinogen decarboxylase family protein [Chloroflexota bacterium]